jgi:DNA polymerase III sliding clamp (beta) subunit (PCNA family)
MTKVIFEAASLASALAAASKVAPTRGSAFEKAAGILLDITADECIVMATDTLVRYSTWLTPEHFEGDPVSWRVPSRTFPELIGKLKTVRNKTLTLEQDGQTLKMTHGSTRATFQIMDARDYPKWEPFSPDDMHEVIGLSKAVASVAWAVSKDLAPLVGVNLDGDLVLATNRYRFASVPCSIPLAEPVTIHPLVLTSVLKNSVSIKMRVDGSQVCIMPDDYTQISMTVYGDPYPPLRKIMRREYPVMCKITKQELLDTIELVMTMAGADRMPKLHLIFGREQIAVMVENDQIGKVGHVMEVPGQVAFPSRHEIRFDPDNFMSALNGCIGTEITIGFEMENKMAPIYLTGGEDLEFWLAPRQKLAPGVE